MRSWHNSSFAQVGSLLFGEPNTHGYALRRRSGVNVKSQLPNTISHVIKRLLANRKDLLVKNAHFTKQIQAINDLYAKLNNQIQAVCIEDLKMVKANDLNGNQIDTLREQYQLLLKQIQ